MIFCIFIKMIKICPFDLTVNSCFSYNSRNSYYSAYYLIFENMEVLERPTMQTVTALEAKNRFGELLDKAQREPVTVTKSGRPSVVVISVDDYKKYDRMIRNELRMKLKQSQQDAASNGMTEEILEKLLKNES